MAEEPGLSATAQAVIPFFLREERSSTAVTMRDTGAGIRGCREEDDGDTAARDVPATAADPGLLPLGNEKRKTFSFLNNRDKNCSLKIGTPVIPGQSY